MQNTKVKEKKKGKNNGWQWKRRRPMVSCSPLCSVSVLLLWTMKNAEDGGEEEGEGKEEEQWLAVEMTETNGELRELFSTMLYFCSSSSSDSGECRR